MSLHLWLWFVDFHEEIPFLQCNKLNFEIAASKRRIRPTVSAPHLIEGFQNVQMYGRRMSSLISFEYVFEIFACYVNILSKILAVCERDILYNEKFVVRAVFLLLSDVWLDCDRIRNTVTLSHVWPSQFWSYDERPVILELLELIHPSSFDIMKTSFHLMVSPRRASRFIDIIYSCLTVVLRIDTCQKFKIVFLV